MVGLVRHRQTKGAGTARRDLPSGGQCSTLPDFPHGVSTANAPRSESTNAGNQRLDGGGTGAEVLAKVGGGQESGGGFCPP